MVSVFSNVFTCMRLSLRKLKMIIANNGMNSKLSKPRIWKIEFQICDEKMNCRCIHLQMSMFCIPNPIELIAHPVADDR